MDPSCIRTISPRGLALAVVLGSALLAGRVAADPGSAAALVAPVVEAGHLAGDGSFGHGGAHATNMTVDPARKLAVVWMVQDAGSPAEWRTVEGEVRRWAFGRFGGADGR